MKYFFITLAIIGLAACNSSYEHDTGDHKGMDHAVMKDGIVISDAWVRPPLPGRDVATAYFHIENKSRADVRLVSASTDVNARTEIHTHLNEDGVMKMRKLDGLDLAKGEMAMFKPGGLHIMMFDVALSEEQNDVALTLTFDSGEAQTIIAEVRDMADAKPMDHSGH